MAGFPSRPRRRRRGRGGQPFFRVLAVAVAVGVFTVLGLTSPVHAQVTGRQDRLDEELRVGLEALAEARREIADEKIPLSQRLHELEAELIHARLTYDQAVRRFDRRRADLEYLEREITFREEENVYLANLLDEYVRNLELRLHIAERRAYQTDIETSRLAAEDPNLGPKEVFAHQLGVVEESMTRLEELFGGTTFEGRAAGEDGLVKQGTFLFLGPTAYFCSDDGSLAGMAEERVGSLEPFVPSFADAANETLVREHVQAGRGALPFDASLGNARRMEATRQGLGEHIARGGVVMIPILGLAAAALVIIVLKTIELARVREPRTDQVRGLLRAVGEGRADDARLGAGALPGPAGAMLSAGAAHLDAPRELIEEVMFEKLLETRARLQRALPFIAVAAASAPLLGLLGTVTGIIHTFELLSVYGAGDMKTLSAGISEALVTTEFGLLVAIPALIAHAFLSRRARVVTERMEQLAIALLGEVERARAEAGGGSP